MLQEPGDKTGQLVQGGNSPNAECQNAEQEWELEIPNKRRMQWPECGINMM